MAFSAAASRLSQRWIPATAATLLVVGNSVILNNSGTTTSPNAASCESKKAAKNIHNKNRLVFLGTGSSTGCPMPRCPMIYDAGPPASAEIAEYQKLLVDKCNVSKLAGDTAVDPRHNRNYRNNPSMVISHVDEATGEVQNVIIDVGKTFREAALRWFPIRGIQTLDGVILTHEHADASFGMDDLRGFQKFTVESLRESHKGHPVQVPVPIFLSQQCLDIVATQFTWLFPNHQQTAVDTSKAVFCNCNAEHEVSPSSSSSAANSKPVVERHVASLDATVFHPFEPFVVAGLEVIPLPIMHGEDFVSFGFAFTVGNTNVVYLSDISRMLPETMEFIQTKLPQTDILVLDSLHPWKDHPVHYSMKQAIELSQQIQPTRQTLLVGMNCDSFLPHDEQNDALAAKYGGSRHVQLAHDGLQIDC